MAAWEKAAVSAAAARQHFQSVLANVHRAQRRRRKRATKQIQEGWRRKPPRGSWYSNDPDEAHGLSDSSSMLSLPRQPYIFPIYKSNLSVF